MGYIKEALLMMEELDEHLDSSWVKTRGGLSRAKVIKEKLEPILLEVQNTRGEGFDLDYHLVVSALGDDSGPINSIPTNLGVLLWELADWEAN